MMGLPPPDTGGCKPKLLVLMGDIIQTLNIYPPSLPLVTERIHSPFQPKQSPSINTTEPCPCFYPGGGVPIQASFLALIQSLVNSVGQHTSIFPTLNCMMHT